MGATSDDITTALAVFGTGVGLGLLLILFLGQLTTWLGVIREYMGL